MSHKEGLLECRLSIWVVGDQKETCTVRSSQWVWISIHCNVIDALYVTLPHGHRNGPDQFQLLYKTG